MMEYHANNALNFSGGPGVLPAPVLEQVREAILAVPGVGLSILGISHRSAWFAEVVHELENNIRVLLGLPDDYHVLCLQGGATQQFSMFPMALLRHRTHAADYLHTGYWSGKALPEAAKEGPIRVVWSGESGGFHRLPSDNELSFNPEAPYLHYVSNETVEGLQFHRPLGLDSVPRICDMSSDFLSAPGDYTQFSAIYAHAQKNIGPAGVTLVVIKDRLLDQIPADLGDRIPGFLDYRRQIAAHSILNTPPVFAIYVVLLVTRWLRDEIGGLGNMDQLNRRKAAVLYERLDQSEGYYQGHAQPADRSRMNVAFRLANRELESHFLTSAQQAGFSGLEGHRSLGGLRASLYNGLQLPAVEKLADFMEDFRRKNPVRLAMNNTP